MRNLTLYKDKCLRHIYVCITIYIYTFILRVNIYYKEVYTPFYILLQYIGDMVLVA